MWAAAESSPCGAFRPGIPIEDAQHTGLRREVDVIERRLKVFYFSLLL